MWFSTLTYPLEQSYRLRWITEIFYFGSVVLIALLVVFNLALVGYEETTVLLKDPNITYYNQWWAPGFLPSALRFRTKPGDCQERDLPTDTALRTNSSLPVLTYYLTRNLDQYDQQDPSLDPPPQSSYRANPMNICQVQNMSLTMEPKMLFFSIVTTLVCDPVGDPAVARRFQTTFNSASVAAFRPDSILEYMVYQGHPKQDDGQKFAQLSSGGPPNNTYLNALGVVDALSSDLGHVMGMRKNTWGYALNSTSKVPVPELGYMEWDSRNDSRSPTDSSRLSWGTYTDGEWDENYDYIGRINRTVVNVFLAIRDAIHLDIGVITPTNIYTNKTSFNELIRVDPFVSSWLQPVESELKLDHHSTCSWGWECVTTTTWAEAFATTNWPVNNISLPIDLRQPLYPSVIDIMYLCPKYERKSWGSLLTSVFIGTFTMYVTIYGIFAWIAPSIDRKRKGPQPWELFMRSRPLNQDYEMEAGSLVIQDSNLFSPHYDVDIEEDKKHLLAGGKEGDR